MIDDTCSYFLNVIVDLFLKQYKHAQLQLSSSRCTLFHR